VGLGKAMTARGQHEGAWVVGGTPLHSDYSGGHRNPDMHTTKANYYSINLKEQILEKDKGKQFFQSHFLQSKGGSPQSKFKTPRTSTFHLRWNLRPISCKFLPSVTFPPSPSPSRNTVTMEGSSRHTLRRTRCLPYGLHLDVQHCGDQHRLQLDV
jgi:hypothetical protein